MIDKQKDLREAWEANSLRERFRLATMSTFPPATPGRGGRHGELFEDAVCAFLDGDGEHMAGAIMEAFKTGDTTVFRTIIRAKDYCDCIPHSTFSRNVMATLGSKIRLRRELGRNPTKQEVREATGIEAEPQRWTEIFKAAGLGWLPNAKPKRGRKKHGDRYTLRE